MTTSVSPLSRLGHNLRQTLGNILIPILAILTSLVVVAGVIALSGANPLEGFMGLWDGAFGDGDAVANTIIKTTPYIFAGLALTIAFRGGMFNIGVEGQFFVGSIIATLIGYALRLPPVIHLIVAILGGAIGGGLWGAIPGWLKARTGANEVITTIMTNYIILRIINWLISPNGGPMRNPARPLPQTPEVYPTAYLPWIDFSKINFPWVNLSWLASATGSLHWGSILALIMAVIVFVLLWRTILGFEIRTVGISPTAARYAGVNVERTMVTTMALSGAMAGIGGAVQVLALTHYFSTGFNVGYGFDSIAVAMLGGLHPAGVVLAAVLFGAMDAGATIMQMRTGVPIDIVTIIQGLVLMFVAADLIVRQIYRIRVKPADGTTPVSATVQTAGESG
ncbi:MAG: ABC transporter permease [Anaerolineae bacterium]|nr:ABC transporter permease [Anaerolineae bacterium]